MKGRIVMDFIAPNGKQFKQTLIALFLGSFVTFADLYSTQPVIPVIADQFQVSPATASLSLSFATGALAIFLFFISFLSNSLDRKRIMLFALFFSSLLSIAVTFCDNLVILIIIRAFQGAMLAGFPSIAMAYINEEFHPKSIGYVIGIYVSGSSLGGLSGRVIVGALSDYFTWNTAIGCLGILSLIISILFWIMLPKSKHFTKSTLRIKGTLSPVVRSLQNPSLFLLYSNGFLLMGAFVTVYNYVAIPLMKPPYNLSQTLVGFLFIIYLTGTFSSAWMGKLADKNRRARVILSGILLMIAGALFTLFTPLVIKVLGLALFTFGFFGAHSVTSGWVGILADKSEKAQASSLYLLFYYAGSSIVGSLGGVFLGLYDWIGVISVVAVLLIVAIASIIKANRVITSVIDQRKVS
jgi:MFS transporter, YNFM family, putative membrane transport protein